MLSHMQAHNLTEGTAPILSKCKVMCPKGALLTSGAAAAQQTTTSHPTDGVAYLNWAGAAGTPNLIFADRSEAARVDEAGSNAPCDSSGNLCRIVIRWSIFPIFSSWK